MEEEEELFCSYIGKAVFDSIFNRLWLSDGNLLIELLDSRLLFKIALERFVLGVVVLFVVCISS